MTKDQQYAADNKLRLDFYAELRLERQRNPWLVAPDVCLMSWITYDQFMAMIKRYCEGTTMVPCDSQFTEWQGVKIFCTHSSEIPMTFGYSRPQ